MNALPGQSLVQVIHGPGTGYCSTRNAVGR